MRPVRIGVPFSVETRYNQKRGTMLILEGYFENNTFHPDTDIPIPNGKKVVVTVIGEEDTNVKKGQTAVLDAFFSGLTSDPQKLTGRFDDVISRRLQLRDIYN
jgi:hypothetical protein